MIALTPLHFNPRSRVGNDTVSIIPFSVTSYFNPRSRVGNDRAVDIFLEHSDEFQSTFPRGERRIITYINKGRCKFQSTFPRGERRDSVTCHPLNIAISIHVPAWGTTSRIKTISGLMTISIHVPAWGTTQKLSGVEFDYTKFQSTFPRGERPWSQKVLLIFW